MTLDELMRAASLGIPAAQYVVGLCYENGLGVSTDTAAAEKWLSQSAQAGFAAAQHELSLLLQAKGDEYIDEALSWLRKSAAQDFPLAQYLYSLYCEGGVGMAPDPTEAFRFCLLAANRGYSPAARRAASMLEQGIGVAINLKEAFHWYYRAAEMGDVDSSASVGKMYASGTGVEKDDAKALEWLQKGQKRGSPWALYALSSVFRFGQLGQPVNSRKADELAFRAQEILERRADQGSSQ